MPEVWGLSAPAKPQLTQLPLLLSLWWQLVLFLSVEPPSHLHRMQE